jgi:hypothetical protein
MPNLQLKDAVIHGTASDIEFTTLEALKLIVLESLGAEQVHSTHKHVLFLTRAFTQPAAPPTTTFPHLPTLLVCTDGEVD